MNTFIAITSHVTHASPELHISNSPDKMAKILITGSADGIGQAAAKVLADNGHAVWLHARNNDRAASAHKAVPKAQGVLIGDISEVASMKAFAAKANETGPWDAVVHNAGLGLSTDGKKTAEGVAQIFSVNSMAPYVLTSLMEKPKRLLYVSSGLHMSGDDSLEDVGWTSGRSFVPMQAYNDTKLHNVLLANAVAKRWTDVQSCSLDPGWVKTKLGGGGAPGSTDPPAKMIASYAAGESVAGDKSGVYLNPGGVGKPHGAATKGEKQDKLMQIYAELSGVSFPA